MTPFQSAPLLFQGDTPVFAVPATKAQWRESGIALHIAKAAPGRTPHMQLQREVELLDEPSRFAENIRAAFAGRDARRRSDPERSMMERFVDH